MNVENSEETEQSVSIKIKIRLALLKAIFWSRRFFTSIGSHSELIIRIN